MNEASKLQSIEELIEELDNLVVEKQNELADLTDERRGLLLTRTRLQSALLTVPGTPATSLPPSTEGRSGPPSEWRVASRQPDLLSDSEDDEEDSSTNNFTEGIRQVLQAAQRPLSTSDLVDLMNERGAGLNDSKKVRGALAYLKRTGKADWPEPNMWMWIGSTVWNNYMSERRQQPDVFLSTEAPSEMEEASGMENTNQESEQQSPAGTG